MSITSLARISNEFLFRGVIATQTNQSCCVSKIFLPSLVISVCMFCLFFEVTTLIYRPSVMIVAPSFVCIFDIARWDHRPMLQWIEIFRSRLASRHYAKFQIKRSVDCVFLIKNQFSSEENVVFAVIKIQNHFKIVSDSN